MDFTPITIGKTQKGFGQFSGTFVPMGKYIIGTHKIGG
jgi:hypothetical protein